MNGTTVKAIAACLLVAMCLAAGSRARADCGSVPFYAPILADLTIAEAGSGVLDAAVKLDRAALAGKKMIDFDPLQVSVFEPQQRAIILWNGEEEILLLSTDQRASERSAILEVIPLPAEPKVRLGSFETFEAAQELVVRKRMWACAHPGAEGGLRQPAPSAGRIAFRRKMGAHDVTIAEVLQPEGFVQFVQRRLQESYRTPEAPIRPDFVEIIDSYLKEGFRWFAFDVIVLDDVTQSRQPIEYRFRSDSVFYPMRISRLERGKTKVDLLVFSPFGATRFEGLPRRRFEIERPLPVAASEVESLDEQWAGFFPGQQELVMDQWSVEDKLRNLLSDVRVR